MPKASNEHRGGIGGYGRDFKTLISKKIFLPRPYDPYDPYDFASRRKNLCA